MKLPKNIKKFSPVEIVWTDAVDAIERVWYSTKQYEDWISVNYCYKQVGYFVEKKNESIVLCGGFSCNVKENRVDQICSINTIPLGCVKSIKIVK